MCRESQLRYNRDEVAKYKLTLEKSRARYQIIEETEQEDCSIIVRVRKQLNDRTDVSEYFI